MSKERKKDKKGQITTMIFGFFILFIILLIAGVIGPAGKAFSAALYDAGGEILNKSHETAGLIKDTQARHDIQEVITSANNQSKTNKEIATDLFKYYWIMPVAVAAFIWFITTRRQTQGGNFV